MAKNKAKNKAQQEQILLKNSNINIFLPENIKAGSNILIFGNTCNFFGVTNNIIFNNDNELDRLGRLIDAINNKCNFYIICSNKETYEYYNTHLFNEVIYHNFGIKAQVKALELIEVDSTNAKEEVDKLFKKIKEFDMHFDICLMNPPYGQSIHYVFTAKTLLYADKVISIMPNSIIKRDSKHFKKFKEVYNNRLYKVEEISSNIFDDTTMQNVAIYSFNEHTDNIIISYLDNKVENIEGGILNKDFSGFTDYEKEIFKYVYNDKPNIIEGTHGLNGKSIKKDIIGYINKIFTKLPDNKAYLIVNAANGEMDARYFSSLVGQIFDNKEDLKNYILNRGGVAIHYMWFDSILAAENVKDAMNRTLLRFSLMKLQSDQHLTPSKHYKYIPNINWEDPHVTTDEGLLEVCGCPKDKAKEYAEYCRKKMEEFDNRNN